MKKRKLELKKKVVAALSEEQKSKIMGGDDTGDSYDAECITAPTGCADDTCGPECGTVNACPSQDGGSCATTCC